MDVEWMEVQVLELMEDGAPRSSRAVREGLRQRTGFDRNSATDAERLHFAAMVGAAMGLAVLDGYIERVPGEEDVFRRVRS